MTEKIRGHHRADPLNGLAWLILTNIGLVLVSRESLYWLGLFQLVVGLLFARPRLSRVVRLTVLFLVPVLLLAGFHVANQLSLWNAAISGHITWRLLLSSDAAYYSSRILFGSTATAIYITSYGAAEIAATFSRLGIPASACVALQISFSAIQVLLDRLRERLDLFQQRDRILRAGNSAVRLLTGLYMLAFDALSAADAIALSAGSRGFRVIGTRSYAVDTRIRPAGVFLSTLAALGLVLSLLH